MTGIEPETPGATGQAQPQPSGLIENRKETTKDLAKTEHEGARCYFGNTTNRRTEPLALRSR